jgi:hypothetical protein
MSKTIEQAAKEFSERSSWACPISFTAGAVFMKNEIDGYTLKKLNIQDKNGIELHQDSMIFGWLPDETENERYFYRIDFSNTFGVNEPENEITMLCREKGYEHNIKQSDMINFSYVGQAEKLLHLFDV